MQKKTIYDLAKELNLAPSTISKALNNQKGVSSKKRDQIVEYAKANGYVANPTAIALKSKKKYTIGILYSELSNVGFAHPFFSQVLQYSKEYLENRGYDLIFINAKSNDYQTYAGFCQTRNIAGIFVVSASYDDILLNQLCDDNDFKLVATDYINDEVVTVLSDNAQGAKIVSDYFKQCNYKNVGIVCPRQRVYSFAERFDSFIKRSKENGININEENIIYVDSYDFEVVSKTISNYLKTHKPPEAIFALSDIFAVATMKALLKHKYAIPEDCAIVGYDDIELARYVSPSLTTIRQNCKEIGTSAAKLLLNQINGQKIEKKIERVPVELIIRGSSKKVGE